VVVVTSSVIKCGYLLWSALSKGEKDISLLGVLVDIRSAIILGYPGPQYGLISRGYDL